LLERGDRAYAGRLRLGDERRERDRYGSSSRGHTHRRRPRGTLIRVSLQRLALFPLTRARDQLGAGAVALQLTLAAWAVLELGLRVRERLQGKGSVARDRGTRVLIAVTLGAAIVLAAVTASRSTAPRIAGPYRAAGLIAMWLGLAIRVWAIAALGRAFRPYRWVRHPSYSGLLLIVTGCGLASGNWLALAICVVLPVPALLRRIHVEEAELTLVLGNRYRTYQAQTKRLIPGLW
jgi:protein-S-isoprenylcysteine O-methyltransferase Ste14